MKKQLNINVRWDSRGEVEDIKKAAKLKYWSFNRLVVESAKAAAAQILSRTNKTSEPVVESNSLTLNQ